MNISCYYSILVQAIVNTGFRLLLLSFSDDCFSPTSGISKKLSSEKKFGRTSTTSNGLLCLWAPKHYLSHHILSLTSTSNGLLWPLMGCNGSYLMKPHLQLPHIAPFSVRLPLACNHPSPGAIELFANQRLAIKVPLAPRAKRFP